MIFYLFILSCSLKAYYWDLLIYTIYFLFLIEYFLSFIYFLIIKFPVVSESIIISFYFSLIIILILKCAIFVKTVSFTEAILQFFFWLLLSEKFTSFPISFSKNIFFGHTEDCLNKILYVICVHSRFYTCPLYRIIIIFVCNL